MTGLCAESQMRSQRQFFCIVEDGPSVHEGEEHPGGVDFARVSFEQVAVEHDEVEE